MYLLPYIYPQGGIRWCWSQEEGWIPDWDDDHTRDCAFDLQALDVRSHSWLEPLVHHLCAKYLVDNPLKEPRATVAHTGGHGVSQSSRCILHRIDAYGESDSLNTKDHTLEALLFLRAFMYASPLL
jgi:hypothetical protein